MPYTPTVWVDGVTPVNATNLNKIEAAVDDAITQLDTLDPIPDRLGVMAATITNWNDATENGWYMAPDATNAPTPTVWYIGIVSRHNASWITQEVWSFTVADAPHYERRMINGVWGAWVAMSGVPSGAVSQYAGATAPSGYLMCDGASVSTTTYAALHAAIGYGYGGSGGSFNVPDLRGRIPVGKGTHGNVDALGDNDGSALANRQPGHRHTVTDPGHSHLMGLSSGPANGGGNMIAGVNTTGNNSTQNVGTGISIATAGASAPLDTPAYVVLNYIIKT